MRLRSASAFVILVRILLSSFAFGGETPDFTLKKLADGVYAAIAAPGGKAGSNAGFVIGENGVLVVDSFLDVAPAGDLLAEIRKLTPLPVRYLVNTHYHLDHTGGNRVFADAGADIVAQRNVRAWERTENLKFFAPTPKPEQKARVEALVLPDVVYTDALDIYLGERLVQVRFMRGHTGGDSVVFVPDAKVVFAGDLFWQARLPNLIDASTLSWIQTLQQLEAYYRSAKFVSGHGDIGGAADVSDFKGYLMFLRQEIAQAQKEGKAGQALEDTVFPALQAKYGSWGFFSHFAKRNIEQTAAELSGTKKIPVPSQ